MTPLVDATARLTVLVLVVLVADVFLRRRSAAARHAVLAGALLAGAAVVPMSWLLPPWHVSLPAWTAGHEPVTAAGGTAIEAVTVARATSEAPQLPSLDVLIPVIWLGGVVIGFASLAGSLSRLRRIGRRAARLTEGPWVRGAKQIGDELGVARRVLLLQSDVPDLLATWGAFRPRVALPRGAQDWPDDRIRAVLCHELAHVQRCDWPVQLATQVLSILQWFNPVCWIAARRLRRFSEMACDDRTLQSGVSARDYAMHLVDITRACRPSGTPMPALPMARPSTLERRIAAMLTHDVKRGVPSRRDLSLLVAALVALAVPVAALHARASGPLPLTGTVYDASGAVLPNVVVTVDDAQSHNWHATTDAAGHFAFPSVAAGKYSLRVSQTGFKELRQDVELRVERDWARTITLQVGDVQETLTVESQRTGSGPATAAPARIRVGGNIRAPRKLHTANAVYPDSMKAAGIEGKVPLEAIIGQDGSVHSVRVLSAEVHPDLARAAADAVRLWKFEPTLLNGAPVEVVMKVTIDFRLKD
jgi:TonB family protein